MADVGELFADQCDDLVDRGDDNSPSGRAGTGGGSGTIWVSCPSGSEVAGSAAWRRIRFEVRCGRMLGPTALSVTEDRRNVVGVVRH
ncbi:hypothetical protein K8369_35720 [Streptomyces sp. PSKA30]|nr:hypothetical protein [Streptomyces sp. PSKA30]